MPGPALQQILGHATADLLQLYTEEEDEAELRGIYRRYWDKDDEDPLKDLDGDDDNDLDAVAQVA